MMPTESQNHERLVLTTAATQARRQLHRALAKLRNAVRHEGSHESRAYTEAFRSTMRCLYRLRKLETTAREPHVEPYPTAEALELECVRDPEEKLALNGKQDLTFLFTPATRLTVSSPLPHVESKKVPD